MKEFLDAKSLNTALWAAADEMRKVMSADVYKDYLLGLVFYKNLSDKILYEAADLLEKHPISVDEAQEIYEVARASENWEDLKDELIARFSCAIEPKFTFTGFYKQINNNTFMLSDLKQAFRDIEQAQGATYDGLFEDFDTESKNLGKTPAKRNEMIASVIKALAHIDFNDYPDDALGDAYEYLISQFASESGKKAGEFYTPQAVSKLIARIVTHGQKEKYGFGVYDCAMGSASLLLRIRNYLENGKVKYADAVQYFGQELKNQTYNLARMNMMLHRIPAENQHLRNGDTLDADWPTDEPTNFDAVVMNPPYSQKYDAKDALLTDPRFEPYKRLPPASKADFAFLLHGFYHLKDTGTMGIVLPHGVLFRSGAEGTIREELLKKGSIYAVIGLPGGIFFSTPIPTCIVVLKKGNTNRDVLFIDASKDFLKDRARNYLTDEHLDKIFNAYVNRKDVEKYAHLASFDEIKANEFNLNIPRYVDTFEEEAPVDLQAVAKELSDLDAQEKAVDERLNGYFKELGIDIRFGEK